MGKIIRPTYPKEFSVGLLILIFAVSFFLSSQVFKISIQDIDAGKNVYTGMFLVTSAVIIMLLVLWEELFFSIKIKPIDTGVIFRNHRTKLKTQLFIYCAIPVIFVFVYLNYEVNLLRFSIWAAICTIAPIAGKLISGIKNYNDYLKLTTNSIEYKNNEKAGTIPIKEIQEIKLVKDDRSVLHKIQLATSNNGQIIVDLDEMELEAFYEAINEFIHLNYKALIK